MKKANAEIFDIFINKLKCDKKTDLLKDQYLFVNFSILLSNNDDNIHKQLNTKQSMY